MMKPQYPANEDASLVQELSKDSDICLQEHLLEQQIEAAQRRLNGLRQRVNALTSCPKALLAESLEELSTILEELNVTVEELAKRNQQVEQTQHMRDMRERNQAETAFKETHQELELEARVMERTAELVAANRRLQQEIAERKQVEVTLQESEEKWRTLVQNAPDVILIVDEQGVIQFINRAETGRSVKEILNTSAYDYVPPEYGDLLRKVQERVFQKAETILYETPVIRADESLAWYDFRIGPLLKEGKVTHAIIVATDVTEQKQAQGKMRQLQEELTQATHLSTLGGMAAGLAHELNQPLAAIATYAQVCLTQLSITHLDHQTLSASLEEITAQSLRAGEIIRRLRSFLRQGETRRSAVTVAELIDEIRDLISQQAQRHAVAVHYAWDPDLPKVVADRVQIQQVFLHVIRNAMEAIDDQPGPREITVQARRRADSVEIVIQDTGPGLPPEADQHLFQPFFTTKPEGLGLGLVVSQSMVEAHGGNLWVSPNSGRGVIFHFTLPVAGGGSFHAGDTGDWGETGGSGTGDGAAAERR